MITNNSIQFCKSTCVPQEIMHEILSYLPKKDLYKTRFINKLWSSTCQQLGTVPGYLHEIGKTNIKLINQVSYNANTITTLKKSAEARIHENRMYCPVPNVRYFFSFNQNGILSQRRFIDNGMRPRLIENANIQITIMHPIPPRYKGPTPQSVFRPSPLSFEPFIKLAFNKDELFDYQIKTITLAAKQLRTAMKITRPLVIASNEQGRPVH